jgi:pyrophosphatase PpaX
MLVVFDFDGVFTDSKGAYLYYFKKILAKYGYHITYKEMEWALGPKSHTVIALLTGMEPDDPLALKIAYEADMHLIKHGLRFVKIKKGIMETLASLRKDGHKLALRTNSRKAFVYGVFRKFKLHPKFDAIITAENRTDKEVAIRKFMGKFHETKRNTVYIGDMINDVQVAHKVGCISVAIVGWHSAEKLRKEKPDYLIRRFVSIKKVIKELEKNAAAGI